MSDAYGVYTAVNDADLDVSNQVDCVAESYGVYTTQNAKITTSSSSSTTTTADNNQQPKKDTGDSWNERFQASLDLPESTDEEIYVKYVRLTHLSLDFIEVAKMYGATIITEHFSNQSDRSVPAKDLGGILGGTKFIVGGILFKLAADTKNGDTYLFGGSNGPNTEYANKGSGHELRGAVSYFRFHTLGIRIPMQALVDYRGFRMVAMPLLPIGQSSIIYGSSDKGVTIHLDDDEFCNNMKTTAKDLHIAPHYVRASPQQHIYSAGDVEGHRGEGDGRHYLLDLSRSCPPEAPSVVEHLPRHPQSVFFRLLRPELMLRRRRLRLPALSPDAFSGWSSGCSDADMHMELVNEATKHMLSVQIEDVMKELLSMNPPELRQRLYQFTLSTITHRNGVNVRHLGLIRRRILDGPKSRSQSLCSEVLLVEMIARCVKNMLRATCRQEMRAQQGQAYASDFMYRAKIIYFLNMVTSGDETFWQQRLALAMNDRFGHVSMNDDERGQLFTMFHTPAVSSSLLGSTDRTATYLQHIVTYALRAIGMQLTSSCIQAFNARSVGFEFVTADISNDTPLVKFLPLIDAAEGMVILHQVQSAALKPFTDRLQTLGVRTRLLALAASKFEDASRRDVSMLIQHYFTVTRQRHIAFDHEMCGRHGEADATLMDALAYARKAQSTVGVYQSIILQDGLEVRAKVVNTLVLDVLWLWTTRTSPEVAKFGGASAKEPVRKLMDAVRNSAAQHDEGIKAQMAAFLARVPYELGGDCFRAGIIWLSGDGQQSAMENFTVTPTKRVMYTDPTGRAEPRVFTDIEWLVMTKSNGDDGDDKDDGGHDDGLRALYQQLSSFLEPAVSSKHDATIALFGGPMSVHQRIIRWFLYRRIAELFAGDTRNPTDYITIRMFAVTPTSHIASLLPVEDDKRNKKNAQSVFKPKKTDIESVVFSAIPRIDVDGVDEIMKRYDEAWNKMMQQNNNDVRVCEDHHIIFEVWRHSSGDGGKPAKATTPPRRSKTTSKTSARSSRLPAKPPASSVSDGVVCCRFVSLARYRRSPMINKALSNIVSCLQARKSGRVVGVRNSLLTRLLRDCLSTKSGGKLVMLGMMDDDDGDDFNLFRLGYINACLGVDGASFE